MTERKPILAIIQARMQSSRLPGKVLLDIDGRPMLSRVIDRVRLSRRIDSMVVATTDADADTPIVQLCETEGIYCYRGNQLDVLDRYYQAALEQRAGIIVRVTADCPLLDPDLMDETIAVLLGEEKAALDWQVYGDVPALPDALDPEYPWDFAATRLPPPWKRTLPIGLDVEVCTFPVLRAAWLHAEEKHQREHVLPYVYEVPNRFRCIIASYQLDLGKLRWTVDTAEDLEFVRAIYGGLRENSDFRWQDILNFIADHPEVSRLNETIKHKDYSEVDHRSVEKKP